MIHDILIIFVSNANVKQLFNQKCDIIHYHQNQFHVCIIETLIMIYMHNEKNELILQSDITNDKNLMNDFFNKKLNDQFKNSIYTI